MAEAQIRGRSLAMIAKDVADGFMTFNTLVLKPLEESAYKDLYRHLKKAQLNARTEKFPTSDPNGIRKRNMKLQRLHQAITILEHQAKARQVSLA